MTASTPPNSISELISRASGIDANLALSRMLFYHCGMRNITRVMHALSKAKNPLWALFDLFLQEQHWHRLPTFGLNTTRNLAFALLLSVAKTKYGPLVRTVVLDTFQPRRRESLLLRCVALEACPCSRCDLVPYASVQRCPLSRKECDHGIDSNS
jgi:hypothetical protein